MTNLEKLQKIASFRIDMSVDVKFDNGDRKHYEYETIRDLFPEYFTELEKALKDYEEIKYEYHELRTYHYDLLKQNERLHNQKVKKLKALEIIKEKSVNIYFLKETDNAYEYNELIKPHLGMKPLTQEEYDLLKEILK